MLPLNEYYFKLTDEGGISPSGTVTITENGTYDVTEKASAVVNVGGASGEVIAKIGRIKFPNETIISLDSAGKVGCLCDNDGTIINSNLSSATEWRLCTKFLSERNISTSEWPLLLGPSSYSQRQKLPALIWNGETKRLLFEYSDNSAKYSIGIQYTLLPNTWYYGVAYWNGTTTYLSLYDENGNLLGRNSAEKSSNYNSSSAWGICGNNNPSLYSPYINVNLNDTFVEINNNLIWGKTNSKNQNMGIFTE